MSAEPTVVIILQYMEIKSPCSMYVLNLCSDICQLFLNKTGGKKELGSREWHLGIPGGLALLWPPLSCREDEGHKCCPLFISCNPRKSLLWNCSASWSSQFLRPLITG